MEVARLHRRLSVLLALAALGALAGGVRLETLAVPIAGVFLLLSLVWLPSERLSRVLDRLWLAAAVLLALRAFHATLTASGAGVLPWVDLLLLLLVSEALKPVTARNQWKLFGLSFALLLAATAYRPGLSFAVAFAAFLALAAPVLMVGHMRRQAERYGAPETGVAASVLVITAAASLMALVISVIVFAAFPRLARGWMPRDAGERSVVAGFGDRVSLREHGSEIQSNTEVVLRVEFPEGRPRDVNRLHWRGQSFDHFDGAEWSSSPRLPVSAPTPASYFHRWPRRILVYDIFGTALEQRLLFVLHPFLDARARTGIRWYVSSDGDVEYDGDDAPVYRAASLILSPSPSALRGAPEEPAPAEPYYIQLPRLPGRIRALADSLTRGGANRYDRVVAVERYLRDNLGYTRQLPRTPEEATLESFLFERRAGHCEYFSSAMAVLLRAEGIPARNVTGFLGGDWNEYGKYLVVTQERAHSWVEVWFPGYGWIQFDPTPSAAAVTLREEAAPDRSRLFLDALEHRWEKWVIDYDLPAQMTLLQRARDVVATERRGIEPVRPRQLRELLAMLAVAALLTGLVTAARGLRRRQQVTTRLYLGLRRAYRSAGYAVPESAPPLDLVSRLHAMEAPGREAVARFVDIYLAARFGGRGGREAELELRRLAAEARRQLRRAGRRRRPRSAVTSVGR